MSEVKKWYIGEFGGEAQARPCSPAEFEIIHASEGRYFVLAENYDSAVQCFLTAAEGCVAAERRERALQQRLTAADDWADLIRALLRRLVRNIDQECYCAEDLEQQDDQFNSIIKSIRAELKAADDSKPSTCTWSEGGFSWHTGCGKEWQFTDGGLPAENGMYFCHSCGKALVVESAESA